MADNLTTVCAKRLEWMMSLSEEDRNKVMADKARLKDDAEFKAQMAAEMAATFQASDTDNDGLLNKEEFTDFMGKLS